jgi:hypothetical protein
VTTIKTSNKDISEESWVAHLGFIQDIVTRMARNSYLLKGWTVTLVAAIFALSLRLESVAFVGIAFLPTIVFAGLDAYYLSMERSFRDLYDCLRREPEKLEAFSMDISEYRKEKTVGKAMRSASVLLFYLAIGITVVISIVVVIGSIWLREVIACG